MTARKKIRVMMNSAGSHDVGASHFSHEILDKIDTLVCYSRRFDCQCLS